MVVENISFGSIGHQEFVPKNVNFESEKLDIRTYASYVNCTPLVDWQLDTATNHQRSLAVLKFRVPRHCILAIPEMVSLILWHPETTTFSVKLINWLLAI